MKQQDDPALDTTARGDTVGQWKPIPYILTVWCVSRVILTGIGVGARRWIGQHPGPGNVQDNFGIGTGQAWLDIWSAWDAFWYYTITDVGYLGTPVNEHGHSAWGFFPLYPWVTRAVAAVVGDIYIAGLLVSNACLLLGAWFLYALVKQSYDDAMARKAVLFLFLFPTAYVLSCLLTEGLFFALSVGAWYWARQGNWLMAGVMGMGSVMTRMVGLVMAPLLALEYLRQCQGRLVMIRPDALWIGLVPVGLGVFMAFCYIMTGNPLQFVEAQNAWSPPGSRMNPLSVLWWTLDNTVLQGRVSLYDGSLGMEYGVIATIAVTGVLLWGRKHIGTPLVLWSVALIGISLSSRLFSAHSMPRYLAVLFPVFMILASLRANSVAFVITVAVLLLLQVATFMAWTLGYIVAL